jgi:RND family efflux transporter MFP subunit
MVWQQLSKSTKIFLVTLVVVPLLAIYFFEGSSTSEGEVSPAVIVQTETNQENASQMEVRVQLLPKFYTVLTSEIAAKVQSLPLREGESFKKGRVLVRFDCAIYQSQLDRATASLSAASKTAVANKRLYELNMAGRLDYETSQSEADKAKAEYVGLVATVEKCTLTAPFSGRINEQKIREQQFVQAGTPVMEILDDSQLDIEFIAPSDVMSWIKQGYEFTVHLDETKKNYPAKITRIGAKIDPVSQSIKLVGSIQGEFPELLAGMSGKAIFELPPAKNESDLSKKTANDLPVNQSMQKP